MARTFLEAFKCVRDIRLCKIYSPTPAHREAFCGEMSRRLNIECVRSTIRAKPCVVLISVVRTDSMAPVLRRRLDRAGYACHQSWATRNAYESANKFDVVVRRAPPACKCARPNGSRRTRSFACCLHRRNRRRNEAYPEKNSQPGFGGDTPESWIAARVATDRFCRLVSGKCKGRTSRDQSDVLIAMLAIRDCSSPRSAALSTSRP